LEVCNDLILINTKHQNYRITVISGLDPLGAARPDPLYLCVILNASWYNLKIIR